MKQQQNKKTKRNKMILITTLVLTVSIFSISIMAGNSPYDGYEAFKDVMKNMETNKQVENESIKVSGSIIDNGVEKLDMVSSLQVNHLDEEILGDLLINKDGIEKELVLYGKDKNMYILDEQNDEYYKYIAKDDYEYSNHMKYGNKMEHGELTPANEKLLDYLMGDLKQQFSVDTYSNGSKAISFELTREEMPTIFKLISEASMGHKQDITQNNPHQELLEELPFLQGFDFDQDEFAYLRESHTFNYANLKMVVDENNQPMSFDIELSVEGIDEDMVDHEIILNMNVEISDINSTVINAIDTSLYEFEEIEINSEDYENRHKRMEIRMNKKF